MDYAVNVPIYGGYKIYSSLSPSLNGTHGIRIYFYT